MTRIDEERLRQIVAEELRYEQALREGIWDDVKSGAKKLISAVTSRLGSLDVFGRIKDTLSKMTEMPEGATAVVGALKSAMAETGEQIKLDETLQQAKELGKVTAKAATDALAADLEGPVHAKMAQLQNEGRYHLELLDVLQETVIEHDTVKRQRLDEVGVVGAMGFGLAIVGGMPILLKGMHKLAKLVGATKTAELLHKAEQVAHHFEEKVVDFIVPDTLSYAVYTALWNRGFKVESKKLKRQLNKEEYSKGLDGVKKKVETVLYSGLLIFFAWNGLKAAFHAGAGLLGFAEGSATFVKGIEIGRAGVHVADIIDLA